MPYFPVENPLRDLYGIRLEDLTLKVFLDIIQIYDKVTGKDTIQNYYPDPLSLELEFEEVLKTLLDNQTVERRWGSKVGTGSTKLLLRRAYSEDPNEENDPIRISLYANSPYPQPIDLEIEMQFEESSTEYLQQNNLAVALLNFNRLPDIE